jgi:hypothetical protein
LDYDSGTDTCIKDFSLIDDLPTETIIICTDEEAQNNIESLNESIIKLKEITTDKNDSDRIYSMIMNNKYKLMEYSINLRKDELKKYENTDLIVFNRDADTRVPFSYIPYNDSISLVYDEDRGFMPDPDTSGHVNAGIYF